MRVHYLLGLVFMVFMIVAFFFGGVFLIPFALMAYLIFYYVLFRVARSFEGDRVFNFAGILFIINALYNITLMVILGLVMHELDVVVLSFFMLCMGLILKFYQKKAVVTGTLIVHTVLVAVGMAFGANTGTPILHPLLTIVINLGLIVYVNIIGGLPKGSPNLDSLIPPEERVS